MTTLLQDAEQALRGVRENIRYFNRVVPGASWNHWANEIDTVLARLEAAKGEGLKYADDWPSMVAWQKRQADQLTALTAERDKLREALEQIRAKCNFQHSSKVGPMVEALKTAVEIATAALTATDGR